jgi:hypothetical protein
MRLWVMALLMLGFACAPTFELPAETDGYEVTYYYLKF